MSTVLEYYRSPARYLAARTAGKGRLGGRLAPVVAGEISPLRLVSRPEPARPGPGWIRLRPLLSGICGSDLALLTGRSSPYLGPLVSLPFVPGHEIVAETLDEAPGLPRGSRVVVDPVLSCATRGLPPCPACACGRPSRCGHIASGSLSAGMQTGFCADTGGGWAQSLVAHRSQLHEVPGHLDDRIAVLVEPMACALHAVREAAVPAGASVVVIGAGTIGLLTVLALRTFTSAGPVYVVAKYGHQRERAARLGATAVLSPERTARALRLAEGGTLHTPEIGSEFLLGGADVAFECTGGGAGLDQALRVVRAGGTVMLSGMPSGPVDLTPLWFRQLNLRGAYASDAGIEHAEAGDPGVAEASRRAEFALAIETIGAAGPTALSGHVDAVYPLARWREALSHAIAAGRWGTGKVALTPSHD